MRVLVMTAIYPRPDQPAFGSFVQTQVLSMRSAGVDVDVLVLDGPNRKIIYPRGAAQLRTRVAEGAYDLVHAHYSYVGAVARTQRRVPVVITYHGDDILGTRDARGRVTPASRLIAAGGAALAELVDGVVVQSEQMARRIRRRDVHVVPHEVDLELFRPTDRAVARAELQLDAERPYVLFAAHPDIAVKNYPLAAAAVQRLKETHSSCELLVVHKEPQPRLALFMSACDALVFPSWQEGSPNIVKQALACDLPVVATDVGDIRALAGGVSGCHIVTFDAGQMAAALASVLDRGERVSGRSAVAHLSTERIAARMIDVYETTLSSARRSVPPWTTRSRA